MSSARAAPLTARQVTFICSWTMDAIALLGLVGTGQIYPLTLILILAAFLISRIPQLQLGPSVILFALTCWVTGALGFWLLLGMPLFIVLSQTLAGIMGTLWFAASKASTTTGAGNGSRVRSLRLALDFISLVLAAAINSGLILSVSIFIFAVVAAIGLSCDFLDRSSGAGEASLPLPAHYMRKILGISFLVLLTSVIIFLVLPRPPSAGGTLSAASPGLAGYTETPEIKFGTNLQGGGGGSTLLHILLSGNSTEDPADFIYLGLIRSKALSRFDGVHWTQAPAQDAPPRGSSFSTKAGSKRVQLEIIREPMGSDALPVPYGTSQVWFSSDVSGFSSLGLNTQRKIDGNWSNWSASGARAEYEAWINPGDRGMGYGSDARNAPSPLELEIPSRLSVDRLRHLAERIMRGARSNTEKALRIGRYFQTENFQASYDDESGGQESQMELKLKLSPIERFLLSSREGNCELFAGSAALLLRLMGVPSRLIVGFRLTRSAVGGVLSVRSGDAHAWLEYWVPEEGWKVFDPTPRITTSLSVIDFVRDHYEILSAYWDRYFYNFNSEEQLSLGARAVSSLPTSKSKRGWEFHFDGVFSALKALTFWIMGIGLLMVGGAFLVIRTYFPQILSIRWKTHPGPSWLKREREKFERLARKLTAHPSARTPQALERWRELYARARFGKEPVDKFLTLRRLKNFRIEIESSLRHPPMP